MFSMTQFSQISLNCRRRSVRPFQPQTLIPRRPLQVSNFEVTAIPVNHVIPTTGFLIRDNTGTLLYSGDTSTTDEIWDIAAQDITLKAAFVETSWPDELADLAIAGKHLTPSLLKQELDKLGHPDVAVYIYHRKPHEELMIERQLKALHIPRLSILKEGQEIIM
jgi:ribonuclease BN (tRNA processing enzyme)